MPLPQHRAAVVAMMAEQGAMAAKPHELDPFVEDERDFYGRVRKAWPYDVLARVYLFPNDDTVNESREESELLSDCFLQSILEDTPEALRKKILSFAGELCIVPEIIWTWFEELHAKLSPFIKQWRAWTTWVSTGCSRTSAAACATWRATSCTDPCSTPWWTPAPSSGTCPR